MTWDLESATLFCKLVEPLAAKCGAHVALTGGCLYKDGLRKDLDVMFYRHKCKEPINIKKLFKLLRKEDILLEIFKKGRIHKASFMGNNIDMFFPMEPEYQEKEYE